MADVLEPGALAPAAITHELGTEIIGREVQSYRQVGSTMDLAREAARSGAAEGLVVLADEQTAGRGRLERRWVAPPRSSLLMTVLVRPTPEVAGRLFMVAALAVAEAIEEAYDLDVQLKWPNDVLINGRKVCGILLEADSDASGAPSWVGTRRCR